MDGARIRSFALAGFLAVLVATGPASSAAAASASDDPVQIRRVDVSGYPTVSATVSVPPELSGEDISLTENGSPVEVLGVRPFLESGQRVEVVLAIDTSESVRGTPLTTALQAAEDFVANLPADIPVGIVTFSDRPRTVLSITDDHASVLTALGTLTETQRGTTLYDGVVLAASLFSARGQHNILLFTDGADVRSSADLEAATTSAKQAGATVFSVGLEGRGADFESLASLSDATGGTFAPATEADLSALYKGFAELLGNQYLVLYRSRAPAGAQVTIRVTAGEGSDSSSVLIPRGRAPATPGRTGQSTPLLQGTWGLMVVLGACFLAAFLLSTMLFGANARARRDRQLAARMSAPGPQATEGTPARPDHGPTGWIPESFAHAAEAVAEAAGFKASLDRKLERAGISVTPGEVVAGSATAGVAGLILGGLVFRSWLIAMLLGAIAAYVPFLVISAKLRRRLNLLHDGLPDVLMVLASSMRAGQSFLQALDTVSKELGEPAGPEFARVVTEIRLGRPFDEAMGALAERVGTEEFKWAILAINVQREVGGNLAEILDTLSGTVREREFVRRQIKVLSAEGRLSIKILLAMPFLMTLYMMWVNPEYMRLLWTTRLGFIFLATGAVLMAVGAVWSRKVVKIDV